MTQRRAGMIAFVVLLLFSAVQVQAGELANGKKDRKGFFVGGGVGGGLLMLTGEGPTERKAAFMFDSKIGGAINEKILLMYNGSYTYARVNGVNFSIINLPAAVQWFAYDNFYIRPGVGVSYATASVAAGGVTIATHSKVSFGADFAAGYEFRLGKYIGLSPEAVYHYARIRSDFASANAHTIGAQVSLIAYF